MAIINRDGYGPDGRRRYFFDLGSDPAPAPAAPDYTDIAAANKESAELGYKAASDRLNFDKGVYEDAKPYVKQLQDSATATSKQQFDIAAKNDQRADEQYGRYNEDFVPVEKKMVDEAMDYGSETDQEIQAGIAGNQVATQFSSNRDAATRRLNDMGIRPDSGAAVGTGNAMDIAQAATTANAENNARTTARDKGISLRAGVANFGRGNKNDTATGYSTSIAAGNSSTGNLTSAANAGLPSASLVDAGYGMNLTAANSAANNNIAMGGLLNQGYGIQMQGYNAAQAAQGASDAGTGAMIGGLAMGGAKLAMGGF